MRGLKPEDLRARAILADNIQFGDLDDFMGLDSVLIGTRLAHKLGLNVGDKITLISPERQHHGLWDCAPVAVLQNCGFIQSRDA